MKDDIKRMDHVKWIKERAEKEYELVFPCRAFMKGLHKMFAEFIENEEL